MCQKTSINFSVIFYFGHKTEDGDILWKRAEIFKTKIILLYKAN